MAAQGCVHAEYLSTPPGCNSQDDTSILQQLPARLQSLSLVLDLEEHEVNDEGWKNGWAPQLLSRLSC